MPSDKFLAWGHGRHACPGRFFATYLMKIMLAHVLVHYDVKAHGPKPKNRSRGEFLVPSLEATFDVRHRRGRAAEVSYRLVECVSGLHIH